MSLNNKIYEAEEFKDIREILNNSIKKYPENNAFIIKNKDKKEKKYLEELIRQKEEKETKKL